MEEPQTPTNTTQETAQSPAASEAEAKPEAKPEPEVKPEAEAKADAASDETPDQPVSETPADTQADTSADTEAADTEAAESDADEADAEEPTRRAGMDWFVLRVASNKESSVQNTLLRKVQIEGMEHLVGRILVPTEKTKTIKGGKQRITETKLYPGYVFVEMQLEEDGRIPQDVFFLIKETTGVGDFVGTAGRPTPMALHEIEKMLLDSAKPDDEPTIRLSFEKGEPVIIREGPFENYEGTVDELFPEKGQVRVLVTIFGRQAPIDLEEWQISKLDED